MESLKVYSYIIHVVASWITLRYSVRTDAFYTFKESPQTYNVPVGSLIYLECSLKGDIVIVRQNGQTLVKRSTLLGDTRKYNYTPPHHEEQHILTVRVTDQNDSGTYICRRGHSTIRQLSLDVFQIPMNPPNCTFSCEQTCFVRRKYQFICSSTKGNPPLNASLFINNQPVTENVTNALEVNKEYVWSYSTYLNETLNGTYFKCVVTQRLNASYVTYQSVCIHGPIFIYHFSDIFTTSIATTFEKNTFGIITTTDTSLLSTLNMSLTLFIAPLLILMPLIYFSCRITYVKYKNQSRAGTGGISDQQGEITLSTLQTQSTNPLTNGSTFTKNNEDYFRGKNLGKKFTVLVFVVILSCGVGLLPILIYFVVKKCTRSKAESAGRESFELTEIPTVEEEPQYEDYCKIPEQINEPSVSSRSNEYQKCVVDGLSTCHYSTTLNDVVQAKLFYERDMRKTKTIKTGSLYIRWTGTVTFSPNNAKRVLFTAATDEALASNIIHWEKFVKRVVQLPKSKHLISVAGIGIDNGRQYLIHERLFRGTLAAYIKSASESACKPLQPTHTIRIVLGILEGMEHIHSAGFLHPGLSTKKVLLNYKGIGKLYDFCLSEDAVSILTIKNPGMNYSLNDLAPEGTRRHEYSTASDVWSAAVLIWQMLANGSLPFRDDTDVNVDMETIPRLPQSWPKQFEYLRMCRLFDCWKTNESDRPTINELRQSILKSSDVDTYSIPIVHGGSMSGYYMPMKKPMVNIDT